MSTSRIKPNKLFDLSKSRYLALLERDLLLHARKQRLVSFYLLKHFRFGSSKISLLLFIDPEDEDWKDVIKSAEATINNPVCATGKCKVIASTDKDGDGQDDLTIAIKTSSGDLSKQKAADLINDTIFDQEEDIQALIWNDLEEQTDVLERRQKKVKIPKTQKLISSGEWPDWIGENDDSLKPFTDLIDKYLGLSGDQAIEKKIHQLKDKMEQIERT